MATQIAQNVIRKVMWPQWVAGLGVTLLLLHLGIMAGWTSPYVAQLTAPGSPIPITMTEASWVVSLLNLGRLIGAIAGSLCVNYLGSKTTILITSVPIGLGWASTIVADHVYWLYASRMLGGISLGMTYSSFSLYVGEIADPSIRGALVAVGMSGLSIGNLLICIMGAYLPMTISGSVSVALCLLLMVLFIWLPESPHHLIKQKDDTKARASILFYHPNCDIDAEIADLKEFIEKSSGQTFMGTLKEFAKPQIKKALILTTLLFMFSQMCGLNNIMFYMETILRSAKVTVIEPSMVVIIVMIFGIFASGLSMTLIDRYGRRFLMVFSCVVVSVSLICLGTEFLLLHTGTDPKTIEVLPIFGVIIFQVAVFVGILTVPSAVLGEIFPPHVKCVAACIGSISAGIFSFISAATYQPLITALSEEYVFFFYAVLLIISIPYVLIFMPETKGKSLQEIQCELMKKG